MCYKSLRLEFGDRIVVTNPPDATQIDGVGIFVAIEGDTLIWVGIGTTTGLPTVFFTNLTAHTVQKVS